MDNTAAAPDSLQLRVTYRDLISIATGSGVRHPDFEHPTWAADDVTVNLVKPDLDSEGKPVLTGICCQSCSTGAGGTGGTSGAGGTGGVAAGTGGTAGGGGGACTRPTWVTSQQYCAPTYASPSYVSKNGVQYEACFCNTVDPATHNTGSNCCGGGKEWRILGNCGTAEQSCTPGSAGSGSGPSGTCPYGTMVTSEATFAQWYRDVPAVNVPVTSSLTLPKQGDGSYVYD